MMGPGTGNLPNLNYLWVGPPRTNPPIGNSNLGIDVKYVIRMASKCENPVFYYCLDENVDHYKKLFKDQNADVTVKSIDDYLKGCLNHNDAQIRQHAAKMIQMKQELLTQPRDRIVDRVFFKDAFSLFLLASQGGYTLDTGVKLTDDAERVTFGITSKFTDYTKRVTFDSHDHIKIPWDYELDELVYDCWMMYASPNALNEPMAMLNYYISHWDEIQNIIRKNERNIDCITSFHRKMTRLIVNSLNIGVEQVSESERRDPEWNYTLNRVSTLNREFTLNPEQEFTNRVAVVKLAGLPIEKIYTGGHKAEYECREIVKADIKEYSEKEYLIQLDDRDKLIVNLQNAISQYDITTDLSRIFKLNKVLNTILQATKELDELILTQKLAKVSKGYESKSNDTTKTEFANKIYQRISQAYQSLDKSLADQLKTRTCPFEQPNKIIKKFIVDINEIKKQAAEYHAKSHPFTLYVRKTRFEFSKQDKELDDVSKKPEIRRKH